MAVIYQFADGTKVEIYRADNSRDGNRDLCDQFKSTVKERLRLGLKMYGAIRGPKAKKGVEGQC